MKRRPWMRYRDNEGDGGGSDGDGGSGGGGGGGGSLTQADIDKAVAAAVARETGGLKKKNTELLGKLAKFKDFGDLDPDEVAAAIEFKNKAAEDERRKAGEFDKWRAETADKHNKEKAEFATKLTKTQKKLENAVVERDIDEALGSVRAIPKVLKPELRRFVRAAKLESDDDDPRSEVIDEHGNVRHNAAGKPMTVRELIETTYMPDKDWAGAFLAPPTSGSGGRGGVGSDGKKVIRLSQAEARDPETYRATKVEAKKTGATIVIEGQ